eukprot:11586880-Karenia_brevis.AAC.1
MPRYSAEPSAAKVLHLGMWRSSQLLKFSQVCAVHLLFDGTSTHFEAPSVRPVNPSHVLKILAM